MDEERHGADSPRSARLAQKMRSRAYRHSYVASHTRQFLARQMRAFRGAMSQTDFGEIIGKRQTVVSRLEDPNYGKWNIQTLFEVAQNLDVAVVVRFVDFQTFLRLTKDMDDSAARPAPYSQEAVDDTARRDEEAIRLKALAAVFGQSPAPELSALPQASKQHEQLRGRGTIFSNDNARREPSALEAALGGSQ
jgi:hypothetical protein